MRARIEFPLSALILLFLLQGISALLATLFALVYDAVFDGRDGAWLQMLLPLAALCVPALPLARRIGRERLLAAAAAAAALARIALCFPAFPARWIASALVLAAGATFLSAAVGLFDRRTLSAGAAAALLLEQLLRFAGWSWDLLLRPGAPVLAQVGLSALATALAAAWLLQPPHDHGDSSLERRVGGMRLRGAVALACILFLELVMLARPEVAARLTGVPYPPLAAATAAICALAVFVLATRALPTASYRAITVSCALIAGVAAVLAPGVGGWPGALLLLAGHAAALVLLAPALTPASGSRKGWTLALMPLLLIGFAATHALTFFAAFTLPSLDGRAPLVIAAAAGLLACVVLLLPRPLPAPRRHVREPALLAALAVLLAAGLVTREQHGPPSDARTPTLGVATFNIHLGFSQDWRFDPARIAHTIGASGADLVALQEAPAGLLIAYGVDLPLWLGQHLGMRDLFAPSKGRLLGDALLTRRTMHEWTSTPLPHLDGDRKRLVQVTLPLRNGSIVAAGTHFGLTAAQQRAQVRAVVKHLQDAPRAVLLGDLNAGPGSEVERILQAAGFRDAFALSASAPAATWPALHPVERIDWVWVRGYDVSAARTFADGGSDHRLVSATLVAPAQPSGEDRHR